MTSLALIKTANVSACVRRRRFHQGGQPASRFTTFGETKKNACLAASSQTAEIHEVF